MVVMYRLDHSRIGGIFKAIRQNDSLAESLGINIGFYNTLAFTIACFFSGLGGAFLAHYVRVITPSSYSVWQGVDYLIYAIIGGTANIFGPIIGVAILELISTQLIAFGRYKTIIYGAILIISIMFLPDGLLSILSWRPTNFPGLNRIRAMFKK